jgi:mono/diheme cytochrome c family protein
LDRRILVPAFAAALAAGACQKSEPPPEPRQPRPVAVAPAAPAAPAAAESDQPITVTDEARTKADEIFTTRCAACHGPNGDGTGPTAVALNPKPRNYHDKAWQASVTDAQLRKTIAGGGMAVGKSPLMPPNPDIANEPATLQALVEKIRAFGGQ